MNILSPRLRGRLARAAAARVPHALRSDSARMWFLQHVGFARLPQARGMLRHYLRGRGAPAQVATDRLLSEDQGLRVWVARRIHAARARRRRHGVVRVPQWRFDSLDWRCGLGSIAVRWRDSSDGVEVSFSSLYRWSPDEPRVTQAWHASAARFADRGARPFPIRGTPARLAPETLAAWARQRLRARADRCYM